MLMPITFWKEADHPRLEKSLVLKKKGNYVNRLTLVLNNPPDNAGDLRDTGSIPGSGRSPGGEHSNLLKSVLLLGRSQRQRRLVGCSPQGRRDGHDWSNSARVQWHSSLLHSTGNSTQYSLWASTGNESKRESIHVQPIHFGRQQKLTL